MFSNNPKILTLIFCLVLFQLAKVDSIYADTMRQENNFHRGFLSYLKGNFIGASSIWEPIAKQGYSPAQYFLGILFKNGMGTKVDLRKAGYWFQASAQQGDPGAQYFLAEFLYNGKGMPQNKTLAAFWYTMSAEQDYPDSQFMIGKMYAYGIGVKKDLVSAYIWLSLSDFNGIEASKRYLNQIAEHIPEQALVKAKIKVRDKLFNFSVH